MLHLHIIYHPIQSQYKKYVVTKLNGCRPQTILFYKYILTENNSEIHFQELTPIWGRTDNEMASRQLIT